MASEVHQQVREFQLLISVLSSVHDTFYSFSFNIFISLFLRYVSYQYVDKNLKYLSFCLHTRMTDFCSFEFNFFSVYLWVSRSVCLSPPLTLIYFRNYILLLQFFEALIPLSSDFVSEACCQFNFTSVTCFLFSFILHFSHTQTS